MKKERLLLFILASIQFTSIMDFMIMMPMNNLLCETFKIDSQQFSFLVSSYTLAAFFSGLAGVFWIDRFDRKTSLTILYSGFLAGTFFCAISTGYHFMLIARTITGLFGGVLSGLILAIIGDVIPSERRGSAMGAVMASFSIASAIGVPVGFTLATHFNWHFPFFMIVAIGVFILAGIIFIVPPIRSHLSEGKAGRLDSIRAIINSRNLRKALLFMFVLILGHFAIIPFISRYMVLNVGLTNDEVNYIYLAGGLLTLFTSPLIGKLSDRFPRINVFSVFLLISLVPMLIITNLPQVQPWIALTATSLFFICAGGRMIPANAIVTGTVEPRNRGGFMSVNSALQHLATSFGALGAGFIVEEVHEQGRLLLRYYDIVGYSAVILSLAALFLVRRVKMKSAG